MKGKQNNLGKHWIVSEEGRKNISKAAKKRSLSKEWKKEISNRTSGLNNPSFKHGKVFILNAHRQHKKEECLFGCKSNNYDLHHEPEVNYDNILEWEGRLINLCVSCHHKIHRKSLKLPANISVLWTKKQTKELLRRG